MTNSIPTPDYFVAYYNGYIDACRSARLHPEEIDVMLHVGEERRDTWIDVKERDES